MELEQLDPAIGPFIQAQGKTFEGLNRGPVIRSLCGCRQSFCSLYSLVDWSLGDLELECLLSLRDVHYIWANLWAAPVPVNAVV